MALSYEHSTCREPSFEVDLWCWEICFQFFRWSLILRSTSSSQSQNKFVETALAYTLTYISALAHLSIASASVTILADTDYYSNTGSSGNATTTTKQRFLNFNVPLQEAHKTGLGSSAALVTAFTAALLAHYLSADLLSFTSEGGKARVHNLAQAAHCAAQGKVGSGFDVAAAVYGSCIYRRFSPSILENLPEVGSTGFSARLKSITENSDLPQDWDMEINKSGAVLPASLRILMCDVDCGSETVGMVKKVLSWRKENAEEAVLLWRTLQKGNEDLAEKLRRLAQEPKLSSINLEDLGTIFRTIRSLMREMSTKARVPIEPKVQTQLLDACCQISGVVGGVVPGAGGFDAIALLVEDKQEIYDALHTVLDSYTVDAEHGDGASIGQVRLLGVQQEMQGIKVEDPIIYEGWI